MPLLWRDMLLCNVICSPSERGKPSHLLRRSSNCTGELWECGRKHFVGVDLPGDPIIYKSRDAEDVVPYGIKIEKRSRGVGIFLLFIGVVIVVLLLLLSSLEGGDFGSSLLLWEKGDRLRWMRS